MPRTVTLPAQAWSERFARITAERARWLAEVTVLGPEPCASPQRRRLHAIAYRHDADELEVAVCDAGRHAAELHYFVSCPRAISVEECALTTAITVDDATGIRTLIRLHAIARRPARRDLAAASAPVLLRHG
jgi:hypothetical protein